MEAPCAPAYLDLLVSGELRRRAQAARDLLFLKERAFVRALIANLDRERLAAL